MTRGIYTAASGMMAEEAAQQLIAQNLANASTTGYKREVPIFASFDENLVAAASDQGVSTIGPLGNGAAQDGSYTDFADGSLMSTGNSLDVALSGNAYLGVQAPQGTCYTRDGALAINAQSTLVQVSTGLPVLDSRGQPITLGTSAKKVQIEADGTVIVDGAPAAQLGLFAVTEALSPQKIGDNLLQTPSPAPEVNAQTDPNAAVHAGYLEASNVSIVQEMVNMIACARAYEANAKAVQAHDDIQDKTVNDVGKVS